MAVIVLEHEGRKRLVSYPTSWEDLMVKIKAFISLPEASTDDSITVLFHPRWSDEPLELDASALQELPNRAHITVVRDASFECDMENNEDDHGGSYAVPHQNGQLVSVEREGSFWIKVTTGSHEIWYKVRPNIRMGRIFDLAIEKLWRDHPVDPTDIRWTCKGRRVCETDTVGSLGLKENDEIAIHMTQYGGKPAIYLITPEAVRNLAVEVDLADEWELTVLYPPMKDVKSTPSKSSAAWIVDVSANGIMSDHATNMDASCLFWEAETVMPNGGSVINQGTFTPNSPNLTPARSRLLEANDLIPYLYKCLEALCLTPAMRTDFITFWLPKFYELHQSNFDIALNFVERVEYEKAARLTFSKQPDAVVRVFMVFGGILRDTELHANWMANQGGPKTPEGWRDVVGISNEVLEVMADNTKFRAVEWGAMHAIPDM